MLCDLEQIAATDYRCRVCGREYRGITHPPLRVACRGLAPADSPPLPGILKRAGRYTAAVARWTAAGSPTRTQAEIDGLLTICQTCRQYNAQHAACAKCGCSVNSQASGLANKLAMATEHCPLGKW